MNIKPNFEQYLKESLFLDISSALSGGGGGGTHLFKESVDLQLDLVAWIFLQGGQSALCLLKLLHCRTFDKKQNP